MKTPEEIKKGLELCSADYGNVNCNKCTYECDPYSASCITELEKDAITYIQQLEAAQPKWISVEDRLPGHGTGMFFMVCRDNGAVHEARFEISNGRWYELTTEGLWEIDVTHWMPLPEPPKE